MPIVGEPSAREFALAAQIDIDLRSLRGHHAGRSFRKAAEEVRQLWRLGNGYFAGEAPWSTFTDDPERTAVVARTGASLVAIAAQAAWPFIPAAAERVLEALGHGRGRPPWPTSASITRADLLPEWRVGPLLPLFEKLSPDWVEAQTARYAG
nr:hypothetical protein [Bosea sp. PAMC 26642]